MWLKSLAVFVLLQREMTLESPLLIPMYILELWCSVASVHQIDLFPLLIFDSVDCPFAILRGQTYQ